MKYLFWLLLTGFSLNLNASKYVTLTYEKLYPKIEYKLEVVDIDTKKVLASTDKMIGHLDPPYLIPVTNLNYTLVVSRQKKGRLKIKVFDSETLQFKGEINTLKLSEELIDQNEVTFINLINDQNEIAMLVGSGRKKALQVYDIKSQKLLYSEKIDIRISQSTLSDNKQFYFVHDNNKFKNNRRLLVFDLLAKKPVSEINIGDIDVSLHSFKNILFVSKQVVHSKKDTTKYWHLSVHNLEKGGEVISKHISNRLQRFLKSKDGESLYLVNRKNTHPQILELFKLSGNLITPLTMEALNINPTKVKWHKIDESILVLGREGFALININEGTVTYNHDLPYDAEDGVLNHDGTKAFVTTDRGGRIIMVDTVTGRIVNEFLIGSANNRLALTFTQSLMIGAYLYFGGGFVWVNPNEDIGFQFSENKQILYVMSSVTDDVTIYDANKFEERKGIVSGSGTFAMYNDIESDKPFIIFSNQRITLLKPNSFEVIEVIKMDDFLHFDVENNTVLLNKGATLGQYSTLTGELQTSMKKSEIKQAIKVD